MSRGTMKRIVATIFLCLALHLKSRDFNSEKNLAFVSNQKVTEKASRIISEKALKNESVSSSMESFIHKASFNYFSCLAAALISLSILSTIYDLKTQKVKKVERNQSFLAFSLYKNSQSLFNFNEKNERDVITCLNGIRALSTLCIIFLHSVFFRVFPPSRDETVFYHWLQTRTASSISAINVVVDSFFVISGTLATKSMLKDLEM
jgi:hypothetical protein